MGLNETRMIQTFLQRAQDGIEAFHVPDLQNHILANCELGQLPSGRGILRDWFFNQQVLAAPK